MSAEPKSAAIRWLEETTGQSLDSVTPFDGPGYLISARVPNELGPRIENAARQAGETVPGFVRRVVEAELARLDGEGTADSHAASG